MMMFIFSFTVSQHLLLQRPVQDFPPAAGTLHCLCVSRLCLLCHFACVFVRVLCLFISGSGAENTTIQGQVCAFGAVSSTRAQSRSSRH
jgi:hypothetical protein